MKSLKEKINANIVDESLCRWDPSKREIEQLEAEKAEFEKMHPGVIKKYEKLMKTIEDAQREAQEIVNKYRGIGPGTWNGYWFYKKGDLYDC